MERRGVIWGVVVGVRAVCWRSGIGGCRECRGEVLCMCVV